MRTDTATHLPSALPNSVAWVPISTATQPAPAPAKAAPGPHPAIAAAVILAGALAVYLGTAAAMDGLQQARLSHLEQENATLRAEATAAKSAKAAYCQGGAQQ